MKAIVVYESHWGNTAAIARAIAEGIGAGALALSTTESQGAALAGADLIVAGSPLLGFSLPTERMIESLDNNVARGSPPPDLSHPSMRAWLATLSTGKGRAAGFETAVGWSPGSAAKTIARRLEALGYRSLAKHQRFVIQGTYGPMRDGEMERARQWGAALALAMKA